MSKKPKAPKPPRTRQQIGRSSRGKGKVYERAVAEMLRPLYPDAQRGIGQARASGETPDVTGTPWWIEAKHYKRAPSAHAAMAQALAARATSALVGNRLKPPLVVSRQDRGEDLVTMQVGEFVALMRELIALRKAADMLLEK